MSRNFIPCLGVALAAAIVAGTPAPAYSSVTEAVIQETQTKAGDDLADRVEHALKANKALADADIDARVEGTQVILEGEVSTAAQRQAAERVASRVKGVARVDNQIAVRVAAPAGASDREGTKGSVAAGDVKDVAATTGSAVARAAGATKDAVVSGAKATADAVSSTPEKIDETWITSKIAGKINADDALEHVDVDVKVNKNVVTITGDVPSTALRDRVLRIARETEGVTRVIDGMTVRPTGR